MTDRAYTDAELDAAVAAITAPGRLEQAQDVVARSAPGLQRVLTEALQAGGWFDLAHEQAVTEAAGREDPAERIREVRTLVAEEARIGMLVGVAVGFQLARELDTISGAGADRAESTTQED